MSERQDSSVNTDPGKKSYEGWPRFDSADYLWDKQTIPKCPATPNSVVGLRRDQDVVTAGLTLPWSIATKVASAYSARTVVHASPRLDTEAFRGTGTDRPTGDPHDTSCS